MSEPWERPTGRGVGRVIEDKDAANRYIQYLLSTVTQKLDGLKVVVDCANGAASFVAPEALRQAGAEVIAIANTPDGWNINDGVGSTHLDFLKAAVKKNGADLGIAHDGDADRCLAVDADGNEVDGDQIIAILATGLNSRGELPKSTVLLKQPVEIQNQFAASGGDDYELCFTAPSHQRETIQQISKVLDLPITRIGQIQSMEKTDPQIFLIASDGRILSEIETAAFLKSFDHFAK